MSYTSKGGLIMFCVIKEKILYCEVTEKLENYCWVRIGNATKPQTIPNNRLFEDEASAAQFIKRKKNHHALKDKAIVDEVNHCKSLYADFERETGIKVRVIDRLFRAKEVEKQLAHLRKKYDKSEFASQTGELTLMDSRQLSTKPSSSFKAKAKTSPSTKPYNKKPQTQKKHK